MLSTWMAFWHDFSGWQRIHAKISYCVVMTSANINFMPWYSCTWKSVSILPLRDWIKTQETLVQEKEIENFWNCNICKLFPENRYNCDKCDMQQIILFSLYVCHILVSHFGLWYLSCILFSGFAISTLYVYYSCHCDGFVKLHLRDFEWHNIEV